MPVRSPEVEVETAAGSANTMTTSGTGAEDRAYGLDLRRPVRGVIPDVHGPDRPTMPAMALHWPLRCDVNAPHRSADFWAKALCYVPEPSYDDPDGASIIDPDGKGPAIGWLRVPEITSAKSRGRIDIRLAGEGPWDMSERGRLIRAKVPELVALGVRILRELTHGDAAADGKMNSPDSKSRFWSISHIAPPPRETISREMAVTPESRVTPDIS